MLRQKSPFTQLNHTQLNHSHAGSICKSTLIELLAHKSLCDCFSISSMPLEKSLE